MFTIILVVYNTFSVPFDAAFGDPNNPVVSITWLNTVIDVFFCVDVVINFRTSYFDNNEGEEIMDGKRIAR